MKKNMQILTTQYADFEGRANRKDFWIFYLFTLICDFIGGFLDGVFNVGFISNIMALALFIPIVAIAVRRMHDVGKRGWFVLVPFYNLYLLMLPTKVDKKETHSLVNIDNP